MKTLLEMLNEPRVTFIDANSVFHIIMNIYIFFFFNDIDCTCFFVIVDSETTFYIIIADIGQRFSGSSFGIINKLSMSIVGCIIVLEFGNLDLILIFNSIPLKLGSKKILVEGIICQ